jgi:sugar lactone lactonase YvrE
MRSTVTALACTVAGTLALLALPATAAHADPTAALPQLTGFHQVVVDSANGYVFLSEGINSDSLLTGASSSTAIVVTDLTGTYITTLDAGDGVEGLALSSDGSTLYAALAATGQVAAVDVAAGSITPTTTTPTQTLYNLGTGDVPYSVALQSGKIWVSYDNTGTAGSGAIGAIDPTGPTFESAAVPAEYWYYAPDLAADPGDNNVLAASEPQTDPAAAYTFSTGTDPGTTLATASTGLGNGSEGTTCSFESQILVLSGGSQFVAACSYPTYVYTYSTTDLANPATTDPTFKSPGLGKPNAIAIGATGTVAAGFGSTIDVYQSDGTLLNVVTLPGAEGLASAGLAWSADGTQLFAVTDNAGTYSLTVFDTPTVTGSTLTLSGPSSAVVGKSLTLTGSLTLVNGAALPADGTLSITRSGPDESPTPVPVTVASDGSFTFTDNPTATGTHTYTANYKGDATTASATASFQVTVALNKAAISLSSPGVVTFGANVTIAGKLSLTAGAPATGTKLTVVRTKTGSSPKTFDVATGADGSFTVTDPRPAIGKYTYTATYAGNETTTTAKAALAVSVARTTPSLAIKTSAANTTYGKSVTVTATLGPTLADRWVGIYAGPAGQAKKLLKLAKVNAQGNLSVSYTLSRNTTFSAVFSGDAHNGPRTVSRGVGVYVQVYMSNSGYFKTVKISGVSYRVYHHSAHLNTYARIVPNKAGECIDLEVQQYASQIGWFPNETFGCFTLNKASVVATYLTLLQASGAQYRMRADYVRGKDGTNLSTDGSWFYFEVVN